MFLNTDTKQTTEINQLLNGRLRIDFEQITLSNNDFKVEGNGFVFQNENKELKLLFFRKTLLDENKKLEYFFKQSERKGGLIKYSCNIIASDTNGIKYTAVCAINPEIVQNVEEISIYQLKSNKTGHLNRVIFYGNYKFPNNSKYTTISTYKPYKESIIFDSNNKIDSIENSFEQRTSEKHDMWKIEFSEDLELNICQFDNYAELLILTNKVINEVTFEKLLHSIDFLLGNKLQVLFYSIKTIGECYFTVNKISYSNVIMTPPIICSIEPEMQNEYSNLFRSYYCYLKKSSKKQYETLLKSHRRIVASSRLYSFNFGQSLAIQIEYLASNYFKKYKVELSDDESFKSDVQKIIDYVKKNDNFNHTDSKKWILDRLEPGVSKEKWSRSKLIKQLINDKVIFGNYDSWYSLRNSSAHGSSNGSEHEELIALIYDCIEIYYTMIYNIIGFEGIYSRPKIDNYASFEKYSSKKEKD
jgi:hypothetical protein